MPQTTCQCSYFICIDSQRQRDDRCLCHVPPTDRDESISVADFFPPTRRVDFYFLLPISSRQIDELMPVNDGQSGPVFHLPPSYNHACKIYKIKNNQCHEEVLSSNANVHGFIILCPSTYSNVNLKSYAYYA